MRHVLRSSLPLLLLVVFIATYAGYFSLFSVLRYERFHAHYFDLGIMHQTVYNSYQALRSGDLSRFLEMTDPHEGHTQVKRMTVHNDIILGAIAPLYIFHNAGPHILLIVQASVVACGAFFVFGIAQSVFRGRARASWIALAFGVSYLLYAPLQKAVTYEFHAVTLAPTFILGMVYFFMRSRYVLSLLFTVLLMATKEQIGLVPAFYGMFILIGDYVKNRPNNPAHYLMGRVSDRRSIMALLFIGIGVLWVVLSLLVIIPGFRGDAHFGSEYYSYLQDEPWAFFPVVFREETLRYMSTLLSPIGYLALFAPQYVLVGASEFGVNILSANGNMRNIYFHYDASLAGILFVASIYGSRVVRDAIAQARPYLSRRMHPIFRSCCGDSLLVGYILICAVINTWFFSALPFAKNPDTAPWGAPSKQTADVMLWKGLLADDNLKVSTTGHLAPHFTARRVFYDLAGGYADAKFIVIDRRSIGRGFQAEETASVYSRLRIDPQYVKIYEGNELEVYSRLLGSLP